MRHPLLTLYAPLIAGLLPLGSEAAQTAGIRYQVADDSQSAPSAQLPPSTKEDGVIKPKTDVDPEIEKPPPEPNPSPANKDVIKPPRNGAIEPK
jgi:hypothetical protein